MSDFISSRGGAPVVDGWDFFTSATPARVEVASRGKTAPEPETRGPPMGRPEAVRRCSATSPSLTGSLGLLHRRLRTRLPVLRSHVAARDRTAELSTAGFTSLRHKITSLHSRHSYHSTVCSKWCAI
jgi:hypothetical protein